VWALLLVLPAAGCETDRRGVQVDLGALARAYGERLDRAPGREQAERMVGALPAEQLNDLGVLYEREGRLEDAAWAYQRAIWRSPRSAQAYVNLGNVLRKEGKPEEARLRYRQAMAVDPGSFEAVNNFADLCAEERRYLAEAVSLLAPMVERPSKHRAYGLDTLGWIYHLQGDEKRAAEALEAGLREAEEKEVGLRAALHEHLAEVYRSQGREAEAVEQEAEARRLRAAEASKN
jgi:Tfp pilus assembly protein PilF